MRPDPGAAKTAMQEKKRKVIRKNNKRKRK